MLNCCTAQSDWQWRALLLRRTRQVLCCQEHILVLSFGKRPSDKGSAWENQHASTRTCAQCAGFALEAAATVVQCLQTKSISEVTSPTTLQVLAQNGSASAEQLRSKPKSTLRIFTYAYAYACVYACVDRHMNEKKKIYIYIYM